MEASSILMKNIMGVEMTADMMFQQAAAFDTTGLIAQTQEIYNEGKIASQKGEKLSADEIKLMIDLMVTQSEMQAQQLAAATGQQLDITRDQIVSAVAEAMGMSASDVEKLYNEGG